MIWKSTPAVLNVCDQALQGLAAVDAQATLSFVGVGGRSRCRARGVLTDLVALVLGRVLLVLGRHANVLGRAHSWRRRWHVFSDVVVAMVPWGPHLDGVAEWRSLPMHAGRERVRWCSARRRFRRSSRRVMATVTAVAPKSRLTSRLFANRRNASSVVSTVISTIHASIFATPSGAI
jgi:hypothetical protein